MPQDEPIETTPRATRRRAPVSADKMSTLQQIAYNVRQQRSAAKLTIAEAAAWCGVGTRFLLDLEMAKANLQIDKVLQVAEKFGVSISAETRPAHEQQQTSDRWIKYTAPANHPSGSEWLAAWHAAIYIANKCKVATLPLRPVHEQHRLVGIEVNMGPWAGLQISQNYSDLFASEHPKPMSPWASPGAGAREENGGPGLAPLFDLLRAKSVMPLIDVATVLRWVVINCIVQDTEHHLARVRLVQAGDHVKVAPFAEMQCLTSLFVPVPHRGLKIGNAWPEVYLRADHWKNLAEQAGVHPKVLFQLMRELSQTVPGHLEAALQISMKRIPTTGPLSEVVRKVQAASTRMGEITQLAERHVAGLKTKQQPKIIPIQPKMVATPSKTFHPVLDDD